MNFIANFFSEHIFSINKLNYLNIEKIVDELSDLRENKGRLFFLGVGGSAGNASHAVNDFRKLCGIECYAPTDNVSELTARTNDEGFQTIFSEWLKCSNLNNKDAIFIFSVGGGDKERNVSVNLISAIDYAKQTNSKIFSIVGRKEGYAFKNSNISVLVETNNSKSITPHSESLQVSIWHSIVGHPKLQKIKTKW